MEDAGYRPPKVQREPHNQRYEAVRPNHMWHLDFVKRHINRSTTFTLILIDDCSRYVVGHGVDDAERADVVIETFAQAVERHGRPERVMHDKGSAFWSWRGISRFTELLVELGVDQIAAEHKEWNGKVEVFNGNLHKELFDVQRFSDVAEMRRRLAAHLEWYSHSRTHHALGGLLVPADRYYGRLDEVLARIGPEPSTTGRAPTAAAAHASISTPSQRRTSRSPRRTARLRSVAVSRSSRAKRSRHANVPMCALCSTRTLNASGC